MPANPNNDLSIRANGEVIFSPLRLVSDAAISGSAIVEVTNMNQDFSLKKLGVWLKPSDTFGPLDFPAEAPPETDYQDLLMWGSKTERLPSFEGGVRIFSPEDSASPVIVTKSKGSTWRNRIPVPDLLPGQTIKIKIEFIVPKSNGIADTVDSRRLFTSVMVG